MTKTREAILLTISLVLSVSCTLGPTAYEDQEPNILWIFLEDTAPLLGAYGTTVIETPNIDALARGGVRFTNVFMPAPVCSPSRSSIITGIMSTTLGLHNHHSSRTEESAIRLPEGFQTIPELFNEAGYFSLGC